MPFYALFPATTAACTRVYIRVDVVYAVHTWCTRGIRGRGYTSAVRREVKGEGGGSIPVGLLCSERGKEAATGTSSSSSLCGEHEKTFSKKREDEERRRRRRCRRVSRPRPINTDAFLSR